MLTRVASFLEKFLLVISCSLIAISVIIMCLEVIWRKFVGGSLGWAEEASRFAYVYALFFLAGPILRRGMHIKVEVIYVRFSQKVRKWVATGICSLGIVMAVLLTWWSVSLIKVSLMIKERSVTAFPVDIWAWQLAVALGMAILIFYFIERIVFTLRGGDPFRSAIEPTPEGPSVKNDSNRKD